MEIINSTAIHSIIGKPVSEYNNFTKLMCTQYAGGIEAFDTIINPESIFSKNIPTNIMEHYKGIEISIMHKFKLHRVPILFDQIVSAVVESKEEIIEKKERSVLGRSLIGGLVLGPMGAIIAGMTGLKTTDKLTYSPDIILTIVCKTSDEQERLLMFTCKQIDKARLLKSAQMIFKRKFSLA